MKGRLTRWLSFGAAIMASALVVENCSNGVSLGPVNLSTVTSPSAGGSPATSVTLKVSAPTAQAPANGQAVAAFPITLTIAPSVGLFADLSLQYRFQVLDPTQTIVQDSGLLDALSFTVTAFLGVRTQYTWRARAESQGEIGPWSATSSFVTPTPPGPTLSCPLTQLAVSPTLSSLTVAYPAPVVANGLPPITIVCIPPSGSVFPFGTTHVNCSAIDGLQRASACTFDVLVQGPALSYGIDIQPILKSDCASCHETNPPSGGFSTLTYETVMAAVQPYNPSSPLVVATQFPNDMYVYLTGDPAGKANRILQWVLTGAKP